MRKRQRSLSKRTRSIILAMCLVSLTLCAIHAYNLAQDEKKWERNLLDLQGLPLWQPSAHEPLLLRTIVGSMDRLACEYSPQFYLVDVVFEGAAEIQPITLKKVTCKYAREYDPSLGKQILYFTFNYWRQYLIIESDLIGGTISSARLVVYGSEKSPANGGYLPTVSSTCTVQDVERELDSLLAPYDNKANLVIMVHPPGRMFSEFRVICGGSERWDQLPVLLMPAVLVDEKTVKKNS